MLSEMKSKYCQILTIGNDSLNDVMKISTFNRLQLITNKIELRYKELARQDLVEIFADIFFSIL